MSDRVRLLLPFFLSFPWPPSPSFYYGLPSTSLWVWGVGVVWMWSGLSSAIPIPLPFLTYIRAATPIHICDPSPSLFFFFPLLPLFAPSLLSLLLSLPYSGIPLFPKQSRQYIYASTLYYCHYRYRYRCRSPHHPSPFYTHSSVCGAVTDNQSDYGRTTSCRLFLLYPALRFVRFDFWLFLATYSSQESKLPDFSLRNLSLVGYSDDKRNQSGTFSTSTPTNASSACIFCM